MKINRKAFKFLKDILILTFLCFQLILFNAQNIYAQRQKVSLDGVWKFKWDNENRLAYPPSDSNWMPIEVKIRSQYSTGFGKDGSNHWAWYKREVHVPESMKGQRIKIRFSAVRYKAYVYWNGKKVGEHSDGYTPFEVDVTNNVKFNQDNELLVGVIDHIALQRPDILPYSRYEFGDRDSRALRAPISTLYGPVYRTSRTIGGIIDNVDLLSYPKVYIKDFHITTSVRNSFIMVGVNVIDEGGKSGNYNLSISIKDKGKTVKEFPAKTVDVVPGKMGKEMFKQYWKNPHLWSPDDPYLYTMIFRLEKNNKVVDKTDFPFGFREFWVEGTNFYLNGKIFNIRTNHFNYGSTYGDAKRYMKALKSMHINQIRLHHSGAAPWVLSMADSMGMTIVPESAFYSRAPYYDIDNPKMWKNARIDWAGLIKVAENHPSVVMYSIENEMQSTAGLIKRDDPEKWERYEDNWKKIGDFVRTLDPTKPIEYNSGKDVEGSCDVMNIHYPTEVQYYNQFPNDLYWLEHENLTKNEKHPLREYFWEKNKPLVIGEFGYWAGCNPPDGLTAFIGDSAYAGNNWYKAWVWSLKNRYDAYKYSGANANPYIFGKGREHIFPLEEVFLKDWHSNFYGGETMRKDVVILNQSFYPEKLELRIKLTNDGKTYYNKTENIDIAEGDKVEQEITIRLPSVLKRINAELNLLLLKNGKEVYSMNHLIHIFARVKPVKYDISKIALYDPCGKSKRQLTYCGFVFTNITNLSSKNLSNFKVLIIGKNAVDLIFRKNADAINQFVNKGGRVIMLEQDKVKTLDWIPYRLDIDQNSSSTVSFNETLDSPILNGIEKEDLRYWRGNHQVSRDNFVRPRFWNYTTITYTGSGKGIRNTPLVTLKYGKGLFIFSQYLLSERMSYEPTAFILFNNMLNYSLMFKPKFNRVGVLADNSSTLINIFNDFGAKFSIVKKVTTDALKNYDVLFIANTINLDKYKSVLDEFLRNGKRIVLKQLTPENFSNVQSIMPRGIKLKPLPEPVYIKTDKSDKHLKISYVPIMNEINAYPLVWKNGLNISHITPWIKPNKIEYPINWYGEPEMSVLVCPTRAIKGAYNPLLAGITNYDLYWRSTSLYLGIFGSEIAPIAKYIVTGKEVVSLTIPAIIAEIPSGKGDIIVDQTDWITGLKIKEIRDKTCRIISNLLNNLGVEMRPNITYNEN